MVSMNVKGVLSPVSAQLLSARISKRSTRGGWNMNATSIAGLVGKPSCIVPVHRAITSTAKAAAREEAYTLAFESTPWLCGSSMSLASLLIF